MAKKQAKQTKRFKQLLNDHLTLLSDLQILASTMRNVYLDQAIYNAIKRLDINIEIKDND